MAIENIPLFTAMNSEEVKPCCPPIKRPLTVQEAHFAIMEKVNACIAELNRFEDRVRNEVENFMKSSNTENFAFKEAIQESYNAFMQTVQHEVNNFETSMQNIHNLFADDVDKRIADFETTINNEFATLQDNVVKVSNDKIQQLEELRVALVKQFTEHRVNVEQIISTFNTHVNNRLTEQDSKIEEYKNLMVDNVAASVERVFDQKAENGEIAAIMREVYGEDRTFKGSLSYDTIIAISSAANGDYYYCLTDSHFYQYADGAWVDIGNGNTAMDDYEVFKANTGVALESLEKSDNNKVSIVVGKNLFNKNAKDITYDFYLSNEGVLGGNTGYIISGFIPVKPETPYAYNGLDATAAAVCEYDEFGGFVAGYSGAELIENGYTFTTNSATKFVRVSVDKDYINRAQLEEGLYCSNYEAYTEYAPLGEAKNFAVSLCLTKADSRVGKNLFNVNDEACTKGFYLGNNGLLMSNSDYNISNYIPVKPETSYCYNGNLNSNSYICLYDKDFNHVRSIVGTELYYTNGMFTTDSDVKYVRVSYLAIAADVQLEEGSAITAFEPFTSNADVVDLNKRVTAIENATSPLARNGAFVTSAKNLAAGEVLTLGRNLDVKNDNTIVFSAAIDSFNGLNICHGKGEHGSTYLAITKDDVIVYYEANEMVRYNEPHNLVFNKYIHVTIKCNGIIANIKVETYAGVYEFEAPWCGCNGEVKAESVNSSLYNCVLSWSAASLNEKVWLLGDSYMTMGTAERVPYHLAALGCKNVLISGFPGAGAQHQLNTFKNLIKLETPKIAVWCLGMNNGDAGGVNSTWSTATSEFVKLCKERNILPILATTPKTPRIDNAYKNDWVKASGERIVDINEGVFSNASGEWLDGLLAADEVHPTEEGARMIALRMVAEIPELLW